MANESGIQYTIQNEVIHATELSPKKLTAP